MRGGLPGMRADDSFGNEGAVAKRGGSFEMARGRQSLRQMEDAAQQAASLIVIIDIVREGTVAGQAMVASRQLRFGGSQPMMVMVRGGHDLDHDVNGQHGEAKQG